MLRHEHSLNTIVCRKAASGRLSVFCITQPQVYMIFFKSNSNLLVFTWYFSYNADRQSGLL